MSYDPESQEQAIRDRVYAAMPDGIEYELPKEWVDRYAALDLRKESPSSIVKFKTCPLQWFAEKYSGMPYEKRVIPSALSGTFVHRVLEVFYEKPASQRTEALLIDIFEDAWQEITSGDNSGGIIPEDGKFNTLLSDFALMQRETPEAERESQRQQFYQLAEDCILAVWDFDGDPAELHVLSNEAWISGQHRGLKITGRIDRTIKYDGSEIIQDYKTGKAPYIAGGSKADPLNSTFLPSGLYAWMRNRENVAKLKYKRAGKDVLGLKAIQLLYLSAMKRFTLKVTPELLQTMDILVDEIVNAMDDIADSGMIIAQPGQSKTDAPCRWCPLLDVCPVWSGAPAERAMDAVLEYVNDKIAATKADGK